MGNTNCSSCNAENLSLHYKCADCKKFILCENCNKNKNDHPRSHRLETYVGSKLLDDGKNNNQIHSYTKCDGCGMDQLIGVRYKCNECYDFDFAQSVIKKRKKLEVIIWQLF